jgi:hypothetical protein
MMAGTERYERRLAALFEDDFPEMGQKYPAPSQRQRVLTRNLLIAGAFVPRPGR